MPCPHCKSNNYTTDYVGWYTCVDCRITTKKSVWINCDANQEEPEPVPNDHPAVWDLVIQDMHKRDEKGRHDYHVPLQPFNHRNSRRDLQEELADAMAYNKQAEIEWEWLVERLSVIYRTLHNDYDLPDDQLDSIREIMDQIGDRFPFVKEHDSE